MRNAKSFGGMQALLSKAQKSHPSSIRITVAHARQSSCIGDLGPRGSAHRGMLLFTRGAPLRHPLSRTWPYANSGIRDRTRPTAIGIQIQISHCEGTRARYRSYLSASLAKTRTLVTPFGAARIPVFLREKDRERERKEDTRRSVITDDPRGRGNLYRVAEAGVRKFEIENQTVKANCQGTSYRFREPWEDRDSRARILPPVPITRILISGPCPK